MTIGAPQLHLLLGWKLLKLLQSPMTVLASHIVLVNQTEYGHEASLQAHGEHPSCH